MYKAANSSLVPADWRDSLERNKAQISAIPSFFPFEISVMYEPTAVVSWTGTVDSCSCAPCAADPKSWKSHEHLSTRRASQK